MHMDVIILGRTIGKASDWDGDPGVNIWFYNFVPEPEIEMLRPCKSLMYTEVDGTFQHEINPDGKYGAKLDVLAVLANIPRDTPLGD